MDSSYKCSFTNQKRQPLEWSGCVALGAGSVGELPGAYSVPQPNLKQKSQSHNMEVSHIEKTNMHNNTDAIIYHNPYCVMADT